MPLFPRSRRVCAIESLRFTARLNQYRMLRSMIAWRRLAADAQELYSFLSGLNVMRAAFEKETTAMLSTNSNLGRLLKSISGSVGSVEAVGAVVLEIL